MLRVLGKNIVIYGGTNAIKSLVPFIMLPILTFHISTKEYGDLALIETTILFLLPFIMLNINGAINVEYFKINSQEEFKKYVLNAIFLSFLAFIAVTLILFLFEDKLETLIHLDKKWIELLSFFTFLRVLTSVVLVIFQASQRALNFAYFSIAQTILDFLVSYYLVVILGYGISGRLIGVYGAYFIFSLIAIYILYKMDYFKVDFSLKFTKEILAFGISLIPHSIGGVVLAMSDRYFISYFVGNSEVGIYSVGYQIAAVLLLVSMSVNQAWTPIFFKMMKNRDFYKIKKLKILLFVIYSLSSIFVYFISDFLYDIFIDKKFHNSKEYFLYLLIGFLFQSYYFLFTNYLFYYKRTKLLALITISGAVFNIILNYILINIYGAIGVAYATAITWFLYFVSVLIIATKIDREERA
jgi:O-antigen/teichoic acid export membrane protein